MATDGEINPLEIVSRPLPSDVRVQPLAQLAVTETTVNHVVKDPFGGDPWEEQDFAFLIGIDEQWSSLMSGEAPTIEEMDRAANDERILTMLEHPLFPEHVVGFAYSRLERQGGWLKGDQIFGRLCQTHDLLSPRQRERYSMILSSLTEQGRLEKESGHYRISAQCAQEEFDSEFSEEFFEWTVKHLQQRGGRARGPFIILSYFGAGITPHQFWAGMRVLRQKEAGGELTYDRADRRVTLPHYEDPQETALLDSLDAKLHRRQPGRDPAALEKAMGAAGVLGGRRRLGKKNPWIGAGKEPREA